MAQDVHFSSDFEAAEQHRRSHGDAWAERLIALVLAVAPGMGLVLYYHSRRVIPDELALGAAVQIKPGIWNGTPVNAHRLKDYPRLFPPKGYTEGSPLWLWLGNSQLHAINQLREGDEIAPVHASQKMGFPVFGLSLPNASLRDHLIVTAWALTRSKPQWLIVPVVFDDLREYDLRPGWEALMDRRLREALGAGEAGRTLLGEIEKEQTSENRDVQGTSRLGFSLQALTEKQLSAGLSAAAPLWRDRDQSYTAVQNDSRHLRNWFFRIESKTKRPVIEARLEANMLALSELLALAQARGVRTFVYVAPVRWDVEPPYFLDRYEAWKLRLRALCDQHSAAYADLDHLVPANLWGEVDADIDF